MDGVTGRGVGRSWRRDRSTSRVQGRRKEDFRLRWSSLKGFGGGRGYGARWKGRRGHPRAERGVGFRLETGVRTPSRRDQVSSGSEALRGVGEDTVVVGRGDPVRSIGSVYPWSRGDKCLMQRERRVCKGNPKVE